MAAASRLGRQIAEVIAVLEKARVPAALIGGLALAPHGVVRATQDVDLLTDASSADALDRELTNLGYRCVHRSADAANYLRGDERLDLLYASRPVARQLLATELTVTGKSLNKDEFVTCGGVRLREVNFKTMESRVCPGLFFAGEVLDIDGITGGFNFQSAWTTGWIAGNAMAEAKPVK